MLSGEQGRKSRHAWARGVVAAIVGLSAVLTMSGAATAESVSEGAIASQVRALGLNAAETKTLQSRVDSYLVSLGGTQISANRIRLGEGAVLTLALPTATGGDRKPSGAASYTCNYKHFCAYSGTYFTGDVIDMFTCAAYKIPWFGDGSWINHQTTGTQAGFRDNEFVVRWVDPGAYFQDEIADWTWVHYVTNC
ncbi:hypothetical protein [Streptomyces sp. NPDC059215]|uniref:hypothetical protein n=1 Tax=Streptomyces sp. NPDC059215 TaxID=3346772 RepID=UPI0036CD639B